MYNSQDESKVKAFLEACQHGILVDKILQIHAALGLKIGTSEWKINEHRLCAIDELLRPWFAPTDEEADFIEKTLLLAKVARLEEENALLQKEKAELISKLAKETATLRPAPLPIPTTNNV